MFRQQGLTLIELLLAISIAAIISLGTVNLFQTSLRTKDIVDEFSDSYAVLHRAMAVLERDIIQISPYRKIRDPYGSYKDFIELDFEGLSFTKNGWPISRFSQYERSTQQRVSYNLAEPGSELCELLEDDKLNDEGSCLIRSTRVHLDDDGSFEWRHQLLLRPVKKIDWQFLVNNPTTNEASYVSELPDFDPAEPKQIQALLLEVEMGNGPVYKRLVRTPYIAWEKPAS